MISDFSDRSARSRTRSFFIFVQLLSRLHTHTGSLFTHHTHTHTRLIPSHADFYYNDRFHISSSFELKSCILNRYLLNTKHTGPNPGQQPEFGHFVRKKRAATTLQMAEITWKCSGYGLLYFVFPHNHQNRHKTSNKPSIENIFFSVFMIALPFFISFSSPFRSLCFHRFCFLFLFFILFFRQTFIYYHYAVWPPVFIAFSICISKFVVFHTATFNWWIANRNILFDDWSQQ